MVPPLRLLPLLLLGSVPGVAQDCRLCESAGLDVASPPVVRPLRVEFDGGLEFGRLALAGSGGGAAELNPGDEQARTDGRLIDLGGLRYAAVVRLIGEPGRRVRVHWPDAMTLRSSDGGVPLRLGSIRSDSPAVLVLDSGGRARFRLGATLVVPVGAGGDYRGPITVNAEYE